MQETIHRGFLLASIRNYLSYIENPRRKVHLNSDQKKLHLIMHGALALNAPNLCMVEMVNTLREEQSPWLDKFFEGIPTSETLNDLSNEEDNEFDFSEIKDIIDNNLKNSAKLAYVSHLLETPISDKDKKYACLTLIIDSKENNPDFFETTKHWVENLSDEMMLYNQYDILALTEKAKKAKDTAPLHLLLRSFLLDRKGYLTDYLLKSEQFDIAQAKALAELDDIPPQVFSLIIANSPKELLQFRGNFPKFTDNPEFSPLHTAVTDFFCKITENMTDEHFTNDSSQKHLSFFEGFSKSHYWSEETRPYHIALYKQLASLKALATCDAPKRFIGDALILLYHHYLKPGAFLPSKTHTQPRRVAFLRQEIGELISQFRSVFNAPVFIHPASNELTYSYDAPTEPVEELTEDNRPKLSPQEQKRIYLLAQTILRQFSFEASSPGVAYVLSNSLSPRDRALLKLSIASNKNLNQDIFVLLNALHEWEAAFTDEKPVSNRRQSFLFPLSEDNSYLEKAFSLLKCYEDIYSLFQTTFEVEEDKSTTDLNEVLHFFFEHEEYLDKIRAMYEGYGLSPNAFEKEDFDYFVALKIAVEDGWGMTAKVDLLFTLYTAILSEHSTTIDHERRAREFASIREYFRQCINLVYHYPSVDSCFIRKEDTTIRFDKIDSFSDDVPAPSDAPPPPNLS